MKTINMPGFTAGASIYTSVRHYRTLSVAPTLLYVVSPQAMTAADMNEFMRSLFGGAGIVPPSWDSGGGGAGGGVDIGSKGYNDCVTICKYQRSEYLTNCKDIKDVYAYFDCKNEIEKDFNTCMNSCYKTGRPYIA